MKKRYDAIDAAKMLLSICVCAIHSMGNYEIIRPWVCIAVPCFFIFSGYFFFKKWKREPSIRKTYIPFFKRNAVLYAVWFFAWLPIMLPSRGWFSGGILKGFFVLTVRIILNSTFTGAWFISALILGTFIICIFSKQFGNKPVFVVSTLFCCICALISNYRGLFPVDGLLQRIFVYTYPGTFYNSFPAGMFYIMIGKIMAEKNVEQMEIKRSWIFGTAIAAFGVLFAEYKFIESLGCRVDADCYFSTMILVPLILLSLLFVNIKIGNASFLRNLSTLNFVMHGGIIELVKMIVGQTGGGENSLTVFIVTEVVCVLVGTAILRFEKKFQWLRYLH